MKNFKRNVDGITLIALVVTIIVLLILAGISIAMLTGENGILGNAKLAKEKNNISTEDEMLKLAYNTAMTKNAENGDLYVDVESLQEELNNLATDAVAKESEENEGKIDVTFPSGNKYTVDGRKKEISTKSISELVEGDYVYYVDKNSEKRLCRVLWDSSSKYGVQIITSESVDNVTLGSDTDFGDSVTSYNDLITTLNQKATDEYLNEDYATQARCVGTHPNNNGDYIGNSYSVGDSYWSDFIYETDGYGVIDFNQMQKLHIESIGVNYWIASRAFEYADGTYVCGYVDHVNENGIYGYNTDFLFEASMGNYRMHSYKYGFRPIFILKENVKLTGEGTAENPYELII